MISFPLKKCTHVLIVHILHLNVLVLLVIVLNPVLIVILRIALFFFLVLLTLRDHLNLLVLFVNAIYDWQPGMDLKIVIHIYFSIHINFILFTIRL